MSPAAPAEVSIVVPTIGRLEMLGACLRSLLACTPRASEVIVVDQSDGDGVAHLVARTGGGVRRLRSTGRGISRAMNEGLEDAHFDRVLVTHDDCVVATDWVGRGTAHLGGRSALIVTGRVEPGDGGDPRLVPSVKTDPSPHDFTGERTCGALYPNNMALWRRPVLDFGGFDERLWFAEDNDLSYRWLLDGRALRYEPDMVVWHRDWRTRDQLTGVYIEYWRSQGVFYAKHLLARDRAMVGFLAADAHQAARYGAARLLGRTHPWSDDRSGIWRGLPIGLLAGFRRFARADA
jgi:GT2 family glycosyltransferase